MIRFKDEVLFVRVACLVSLLLVVIFVFFRQSKLEFWVHPWRPTTPRHPHWRPIDPEDLQFFTSLISGSEGIKAANDGYGVNKSI